MSAAETSEGETLEGMTPFERRNMYQHRYSWFFWEFAHQSHTGECDVVQPAGDTRSNRVLTQRSVCAACRVTRLLELCNGDATLMMSWFGVAQSINNLLSVFISPVVGSLSDAGGRPVHPVCLRSC